MNAWPVRPRAIAAGLALVAGLAACGDWGEGGPQGARPGAPAAAGAPPNVVLIVLDTARADRMSYGGSARETTPHVDRLARDGVVYRNAHSVAPWTLPSHMSMFTGLPPALHGATWEAFGEPADMSLGEVLDRSFAFAEPARLLPQRLRDLGYHTLGFSSNAWIARRTGFDQGFVDFVELWNDGRTLEKAHRALDRLRVFSWLPRPIRARAELGAGDAGELLARFRERAEPGLPQPFFLFFNFIDPHFPYAPPRLWRYAYSDDEELGEDLARFRLNEMAMVAGERPVELARLRPFYDAEVRYVDFAVGRLLDWLRERGLYDDALIVVVSDHGEHLGEGDRFSHQFSVEEELLRIPLVIKFPGNAGAGRVVANPLVSNLDLYQTILRAAGDPGRAPPTPSRDLARMDAFDREFLVAEYYHSLPFLRAHARLCERFSVQENAVTRRVVYDADGRTAFVERDGVQAIAASEGHDAVQAQRAAARLRRYLESAGSGMLEARGGGLDEATRKRLRALGYAD